MFAVEGIKTVKELLDSNFEAHKVYTIDQSLIVAEGVDVELISEADLKRVSNLKNPNKILGVFMFPSEKPIHDQGWILALDDVRDPGNLGTIIRLCDWFGVKQLICSDNTVDCFNPKVLQATMGSITRVNIVYTDLLQFIKSSELTVYGTFMDGANVHTTKMPEKGILVMGNEANGISKEIENLIGKKIAIPQFGGKKTESLNVATATAIFLNEIRRA